MSEREIAHFGYKRETIPTSMASDDACYLVIITGDQIEILSNLLNYAHDRRSWNDETIDSERYYLPDDDDWNDIEAIIDDLEYRLMSKCDYVTLDDDNERVGIGTTSPDVPLEIVGDGPDLAKVTDGAGLGLVVATDDVTIDAENSITLDSSQIDLQAAGSAVVSVVESLDGGRVGMCGVSPNSRLDIGAGAITLAEMTPPGSTPSNQCVLFVKDDGTGKTALIAKFASVSRILATE